MESEIACQRYVQRMFPTALRDLEQPVYRCLLAFQPFAEQGLSPAIGQHSRITYQLLRTSHTTEHAVHLLRVREQAAQVVLVTRILQLALGHQLAARVINRFVRSPHDVQDDAVVRLVQMMVMLDPVACAYVQFNIADPFVSVYQHARMTVIRSCVAVMLAYGENLHPPSVGRLLRVSRPQTPLPDIMQNDLRHVALLSDKMHGLSRLVFRFWLTFRRA